MNLRKSIALILFTVIASALAQPLRAQTVFEKLVMPGPLIEGHAKLEKECKNCHEPFDKKKQKPLCLACHKKVAKDLKSGKGFHGRQKDIATKECKFCHTDHKGRKLDIVGLDRETFNHRFTDFQLKGAHKTTQCADCHKAKVKFRDTPATCVKCHKQEEPHKGRLGDKCETCHRQTLWRPAKPFDHDKTKFKLTKAHKKVSCKACHGGELYKDLGTSCLVCHDLQDSHKSNNGAKCELCHTPNKWKKVKFDHDKNTKFPLKGLHKKVKCEICHQKPIYDFKLPSRCVDCHKHKDPHKGQLGAKCEQCHNEKDWRRDVLFDHDLTRFPLNGRHAKVKCKACHKSRKFKQAPRRCAACHKDKFHIGRLGPSCGSCHTPRKWAQWRFDHNKRTKFPLTGAHIKTHCHACHKVKRVKKVTAPTKCYACHSGDDVHRGAFGRTCEQCHSTKSFRLGVRR